MKKIISKPAVVEKIVEKVTEFKDEIVEEQGGMMSLLGKNVLLLCNYFYYGKLTGVNEKCVELSNPTIVYDTGAWDAPKFSSAEKLPLDKLYVNLDAIESFGEMNK